jgi:protein SCO1/2
MPQRPARAFARRICEGAAVSVTATSPLPGRKVLLALAAIVAIAMIVLVIAFATRRPDPKLEDFGRVPAFQLVDERALPFSEDALAGHVTLVSFLFTRCDTICPVTTMKMEHLQEQTFDVGDRVKLVSFSVDPTYDTPERLAAYAQRYHADPARWRFVTGPIERVHPLIEGAFMMSMMRKPDRPGGIPDIAHQGFFVLVDPTLHIRGMYESKDVQRLDEMIRDARFLARTML